MRSGSFGDVGAYLPVEKGERGGVGISVSGWVWEVMDSARMCVQQGLGEFMK